MPTSTAKENRRLYTLKVTDAEATPPTTSDEPVSATPQPTLAIGGVGPIRTQRKSTQARLQAGPMSTALKTHDLRSVSSGSPGVSDAPSNATVPLAQAGSTTPTHPPHSTIINHPIPDSSPIANPPPSGCNISGDVATVAGTQDSGVDELASPWTRLQTTTDPNGMDVDEGVPLAALDEPSDSTTQTAAANVGTSILVETSPPSLLFVDEDERPGWLLRSVKEHLQYTPCYLCLSEVIDLFLAQEARLGYPAKVCIFPSRT